MQRDNGRWTWLWTRSGLAILAIGFLAGCGAQDLYTPPTAPYSVAGRLGLPSQVEDVAVLGNTAFVAGGQAGLLIVDVSDPKTPSLVQMLDTVKYAESVRVASTYAGGEVVDIAFVVEGTEGITTYDVSDPANAYSFQQGTTAVDGNGLFISVPDDPSEPYVVYLAESWKGLRIFESDPAVPGLLRYNGVFSSTRGYAMSVAMKDGFAYIADDELGLAVLDVRNRVLGAVAVVSSCDTEGDATGVDVVGDYAFIADGHNGLAVMECQLEGDPLVPVPRYVAHLDLPGRCRAIVVRDGTAFIAAQDGGVHIVDVTTPSSPVLAGTVLTSYATGIALSKSGLVVVSDRDEGLLVLQGPGPFSDSIAPSNVTDLSARGVDSTSVVLEWHAPGDDRLSGRAAGYDIRYVEAGIDGSFPWNSAIETADEPAPGVRGTAESHVVTGLLPGTEYTFALRTVDGSGNWSGVSNVAQVVTPVGNVPPVLSGGSVSPDAGLYDESFVFEVIYQDGDGDAPEVAEVWVDDVAYAMTAVTTSFETGALFRYEGTLNAGAHDHYYRFGDGHHGPTDTDVFSGPAVGRLLATIGSPADEPGRDTDETPHPVLMVREFEIASREVTQAEYEAVMGTNPSRYQGANLPVERVSWFDAVEYCNALSISQGLTPAYDVQGDVVTWDEDADGWRLPTEAEWEVSCRAGTTTPFANGDLTEEACGIDPVLTEIGWYCGNAEATTHPAGSKRANGEGLFDMHGNVWEWCWDWFVSDLGSGAAVDPQGPAGGSQRAIRGGSWYHFARECRSASRAPYWPGSKDDIVGFRVARTIFQP
ncbi:MAG: SUMF1/EgtB/PvdO family nonheme iron enzyme [Candidatus Eisenbacteria bacterium]|uniref:SUMF1/EgtB/PvdO family nonheme iron enzyme n=1 Tax=Eiseniibacteriota bacterium TaxID=2212470 RepID=A0A956NFA3_UNCEI|nr:SUMF1/EgtB/PvdO family nonheme iron enzyme [Candidatus Eisenbacteria bacterium]